MVSIAQIGGLRILCFLCRDRFHLQSIPFSQLSLLLPCANKKMSFRDVERSVEFLRHSASLPSPVGYGPSLYWPLGSPTRPSMDIACL